MRGPWDAEPVEIPPEGSRVKLRAWPSGPSGTVVGYNWTDDGDVKAVRVRWDQAPQGGWDDERPADLMVIQAAQGGA